MNKRELNGEIDRVVEGWEVEIEDEWGILGFFFNILKYGYGVSVKVNITMYRV